MDLNSWTISCLHVGSSATVVGDCQNLLDHPLESPGMCHTRPYWRRRSVWRSAGISNFNKFFCWFIGIISILREKKYIYISFHLVLCISSWRGRVEDFPVEHSQVLTFNYPPPVLCLSSHVPKLLFNKGVVILAQRAPICLLFKWCFDFTVRLCLYGPWCPPREF